MCVRLHACVCVCVWVCVGTCNDVNKTCGETDDAKQESGKTTDNEQIQLKVGQCNEMFIA